MTSLWTPGAVLLCLLGVGYSTSAQTQEQIDGESGKAYPVFDSEPLIQGRKVWMGNCEGCHGYGIAGAPLIGDSARWAPRIDQGRDVLYGHAIEGFFGPKGTYMPERGGNPDLTDEEVKRAVDYMVEAANVKKHVGAMAPGEK